MWRTGETISGFLAKLQQSPQVIQDSRLNECHGGEVGCQSSEDRAKVENFYEELRSMKRNSQINEHILVVGHSRKGYELLKGFLLKESFWDKRSESLEAYTEDCYKSGRWYTCKAIADNSVLFREYSYIHNGLAYEMILED